MFYTWVLTYNFIKTIINIKQMLVLIYDSKNKLNITRYMSMIYDYNVSEWFTIKHFFFLIGIEK